MQNQQTSIEARMPTEPEAAGLNPPTHIEEVAVAEQSDNSHALPLSVEFYGEVPSDPDVPSERSDSSGSCEGLDAAKRTEATNHSPPCLSEKRGEREKQTTQDKVMISLRRTLVCHRDELQGYLEDWSNRQNRILTGVLSDINRRDGIHENSREKIDRSRFTKRSDTQFSASDCSPVSKASNTRSHCGFSGISGDAAYAECSFTACAFESGASAGNVRARSERVVNSNEVSPALSADSVQERLPTKRSSTIGSNGSRGKRGSVKSGRASMFSRYTTGRASRGFFKGGVLHTLIGEATKMHLGPQSTRTRDLANVRFVRSAWVKAGSECYKWACNKYHDGKDFLGDKALQNSFARVVLSNGFEGLCAVIILANSICLGYNSDYAMHNLDAPSTETMDIVELAFTAFYTLELLLRLIVLGWAFVFTDDWKWNFFDMLLVASAVWDQLTIRLGGSSGGNASVLRIMRLTKMMKLLRMFRILRMFRELRLILNSIVGSMRSMIWSILLIVIITYVIGIVFLQASTVILMDGTDGKTEDGIHKYWGSLLVAMLSLYTSSTGGIDWIEVAESLETVGVAYYILFLLYIAFFLFVVMNTLTSLFVETAMKNAEQDQHMVIQDELKRKNEYIAKIRSLYKRIAQNNKVELYKEDFDKVLQDTEMLAFLSSVEIDSMDVEQFFNILSCDGTQGVDIETFVVGCMKLRGMARSLDLLGLIHQQRHDAMRLRQMQTEMASIKDLVRSGSRRREQTTMKAIPSRAHVSSHSSQHGSRSVSTHPHSKSGEDL